MMENHELIRAQGESGVSPAGIVAEFHFENFEQRANRKRLYIFQPPVTHGT